MKGFARVNGVVAEVIESRQEVVNDRGIHRDLERERWMERKWRMERCQMLYDRNGRSSRSLSEMREDVDDVLPKRDYYIDYYAKLRVHYKYRGKNWENIAETDEASFFHAGMKVKLDIQKENPNNIQSVSYTDWLSEKISGVTASVFLLCFLLLYILLLFL